MEPMEAKLSFVPCVEDDWRRPRHRESDANTLSLARRLAFLEGHVEEAYNLLETGRRQGDFSSSWARREWKEAALTLLSLHNTEDDASRWVASDLLPLPSKAARTALGKMDNVMYHYCILYWVKLAVTAMMHREMSYDMSLRAAADTLLFVLKDICCMRLSLSSRCLPTWRLLEHVLLELLRVGESSADASVSSALDVVRRMHQYLGQYIIRYLEMRDRPMEGQRGLLTYRGVFDRQSGGMNGGDDETAGKREEEGVERIPTRYSPREVCGALRTLCRSGDTCGSLELLKDSHPTDSAAAAAEDKDEDDKNILALEAFLDHYFFRSAPVAFERPLCSSEV
ncbi:hypothetical protein TcG_06129 [Trypanosoma cruzi]|nr:hypothetical protein C4B63_122g22 [Trypanosoma cruzi]PWU94195.1 hypothetical protein C4B63_27g5 [Trypanosoma cruzi]RNF16988.1 hypothetical protein TcG_06129 [Trypanosoma cruzi]